MSRKLKLVSFLVDEESDITLLRQDAVFDSYTLLNARNELINENKLSSQLISDNVISTSRMCIDPALLSDELQEIINIFLN